MKYYMMKYDDNWADEMDVDGVCFITEETMKLFKEKAKRISGGEFGVGSNESIEYEDESDVLRAVEFKKLTEDEYKLFEKKIGNLGFASSFLEWVIYDYEDEENWDEDEE